MGKIAEVAKSLLLLIDLQKVELEDVIAVLGSKEKAISFQKVERRILLHQNELYLTDREYNILYEMFCS